MKKLINIQLEEEDIEKLKKLAKAENRTMSSYLRNVILEAYKKHEQDKQDK